MERKGIPREKCFQCLCKACCGQFHPVLVLVTCQDHSVKWLFDFFSPVLFWVFFIGCRTVSCPAWVTARMGALGWDGSFRPEACLCSIIICQWPLNFSKTCFIECAASVVPWCREWSLEEDERLQAIWRLSGPCISTGHEISLFFSW